jgi:hypothetical protein
VHAAGAHVLGVHARLGTQNALSDLLLAHFQGEDSDVVTGRARARRRRQRGMNAHLHGAGRFAHRGPCGDDDQVGCLEPGREVVQADEAGVDPDDLAVALMLPRVDRIVLLA